MTAISVDPKITIPFGSLWSFSDRDVHLMNFVDKSWKLNKFVVESFQIIIAKNCSRLLKANWNRSNVNYNNDRYEHFNWFRNAETQLASSNHQPYQIINFKDYAKEYERGSRNQWKENTWYNLISEMALEYI